MNTASCEWVQDDEDSNVWGTSCGNIFCLEETGPEDLGMRFCCFCGKPLVEVLWEDREDVE